MSNLSAIWKGALAAAPLPRWVVIFSGPAISLGVIGLVYWVLADIWPKELASDRLHIIGNSIYGLIGLLYIVMVSLTAVSLRLGFRGTSLDISADEPAAVRTTVETTVGPKT